MSVRPSFLANERLAYKALVDILVGVFKKWQVVILNGLLEASTTKSFVIVYDIGLDIDILDAPPREEGAGWTDGFNQTEIKKSLLLLGNEHDRVALKSCMEVLSRLPIDQRFRVLHALLETLDQRKPITEKEAQAALKKWEDGDSIFDPDDDPNDNENDSGGWE